jgi:hypothetical protein
VNLLTGPLASWSQSLSATFALDEYARVRSQRLSVVTVTSTTASYGVTPPSSSRIFPRTVSGPASVGVHEVLALEPNGP